MERVGGGRKEKKARGEQIKRVVGLAGGGVAKQVFGQTHRVSNAAEKGQGK